MINHLLFQFIERSHFNKLEQYSKRICYKKGEILFHQGDEADFIYYIEKGTLKILKTSSEGWEKIFSLYQRKQLVALSTLFNPPHHYPATAMAVEETEVIQIPRVMLERGILSSEQATCEWFKHLNQRLEGVQQLLTDQVFVDTKERFRKWLQRFADEKNMTGAVVTIHVPVTKQEVADLLSIRRETFSRLLKELKEEGICQVQGKTFFVNREWLMKSES